MSALKSIALACVIALVGILLVGIQQYRVLALEGRVSIETKGKVDAVAANEASQATITTLQAEAKRNAAYSADLVKRIRASEDKAKQARKNFEDLKRNSKPVRDWAAQPLPDGLRSKTGGSNKDQRPKN